MCTLVHALAAYSKHFMYTGLKKEDLTEKKQISITALAESPEHRATLVELIVRYLPDNAQVMDSFVESIKEESLTESMLNGIREEIKLIDK